MKTMKKVALAVALTAMTGGAMALSLTTTNNTSYCSNARTVVGFLQSNATPARNQHQVGGLAIGAACKFSYPCTVPLYMSNVLDSSPNPNPSQDTTCTAANMVDVGIKATLNADGTVNFGGQQSATGTFTDSTGKSVTVVFSTSGTGTVSINS